MNCDVSDYYLIPPIGENRNDDYFTKYNYVRGDVQQPTGLKIQPNHITQLSKNRKTNVGTSSSYILKKITNKFLREQLLISNFIQKQDSQNNLASKRNVQKSPIASENVIKITVVPITRETSKNVLKRNQIIKKIYKTVSITNSSIKNKIFSLPRLRRETYNIKETSSADLFKSRRWKTDTKHDQLSLNQMTYTKTIINSLNMNHKGKHEMVSQEPRKMKLSPRSTKKSNKGVEQGCTCSDKINNVLDDMYSKKNRVTLVGRLGFDENDQYVLNCAATVNNEPIETNVLQQNLSSVQINQFENIGELNKITRATQADINICLAPDKAKNRAVNNKTVQCYCTDREDVAPTISQCGLKKSVVQKNPLIVISVYPRKDTMEDIKDLNELIQIDHIKEPKQSDKNQYKNFRTMGSENKIEGTSIIKNNTRSSVNRYPSFKANDKGKIENRTIRKVSPPPPMKRFNNDKVENRSLRSRSRSPAPGSRPRSPALKTVVKDNNKNRLTHPTIQKSFKSPDRQSRNKNVAPQKDKSNRKPVTINTAQTSKVFPFKDSYGETKDTISKKNKIKKAIVDDYTQRFLKPVKEKKILKGESIKPQSNASSVTIDIDGENERYRVLFLQDKLNTDLNIRKTLKTPNSKVQNDLRNKEKGYTNKESMGNYSITAKENILGKHMEKLYNQINHFESIDKEKSGIRIRDSLEMRHWREDGNNQNKTINHSNYEPTVKIVNKTVKSQEKRKDLSAPVKHYRGDQCCVPNPTLRDQEIRDLLGIKKPRSGKSEFIQEVLPEFVGQKRQYKLLHEDCARKNSSATHHSNFETKYRVNSDEKPKFISASTQYDESVINSYKQMVLNRNIHVFLQVEQFTKQKPIMLSRKQYEKVKKTIQKKSFNKMYQEKRRLNNSTKCSFVSVGEIRKIKKHIPNVKISRTVQAEQNSIHKQEYKDNDTCEQEEIKPLLILHSAEKMTKHAVNLPSSPRQVVSSMEVHYASLTNLRHVTFSSNKVKSKNGESELCQRTKDCPSVQTIFKGHKKCFTPNLGTSAYSLCSDEAINNSDNKYTLYLRDEKSKKPFLRRLMSCLVMRSNRTSEAILPRYNEQLSLMNSFDSYHISTSLGAIELTSSLYDTSASFYSNHTILPIGNMKRGFLSSVRGFLTNLKSR